MKIQLHFNIEYYTRIGENICILGSVGDLGLENPGKAAPMVYTHDGKWELTIDLARKPEDVLRYKYLLKDDRNNSQSEWGEYRTVDLDNINNTHIYLHDFWRPQKNYENVFFSSAFTGCLMQRFTRKQGRHQEKYFNHRFRLYAPRIHPVLHFCISGNDKSLGEWDPEKALVMDDSDFPLWSVDVLLQKNIRPLEYKYGIYDKKEGKLIAWESGGNRIHSDDKSLLDDFVSIHTDESFRYPQGLWKGAGIAIPVFSIRTRNSWGNGEFYDLKLLVDWAAKTGMRIIQILPVNDTIAGHDWMDSYPYAAISVYALHPMYLHCPGMGLLESQDEMEEFRNRAQHLNQFPEYDYLEVMKLKSRYYKKIFDQSRDKFLEDAEYKRYFNENKDWLVPYAAFSCLRDRYNTSDFTQWKKYSAYDSEEISLFVEPGGQDYDDIAVHYFIQFHLHKQLTEVSAYARMKGVVLKGDIPIGIFRNSVDAWVHPEIYNMDRQAGAPPDAYSETGQNWKFPTYNWEKMAQDNYSWWRSRLTFMARYFDAYRIDHVLGFFRIWEIPIDAVEGLMGKFNPAIPMQRKELELAGLYFEYDRFCRPYIREYMLDMIFGESKGEVITKHLVMTEPDRYSIRKGWESQKKIGEIYAPSPDDDAAVAEKKNKIMLGMFQLTGNLLFFEEPGSDKNAFHPKIAFHQTLSYKEFDDHTKGILNGIYTHYFYHRQENFWREQAMIKLPVITGATNMLVCGEDLGMVPDCVPGVLEELNILRLYIQRMPKENNTEFGRIADAPYLSVSSPSCHDMSTVRGWWEDDHDRAQRFYNIILGRQGQAPAKCEPWISEEILARHFQSPSMWAIFPIQDLLGIDEDLRRENPFDEQINDPSNPVNQWKYRMHVYVEDLLQNHDFNRRLLDLVLRSGRKNSI
ncbi:MAG TPA: 4-alpha-glucanotransferase [Cyclobacteriaceae bacterium]|nr:4-alpha-glucanotransferase [Cyclobacteriaceae bacterium]